MNWVDLVVLAVVLLSGLYGLTRGLVREVLGLCAMAGAVLAAFSFFQYAQPRARELISNPELADPVAFGFVFLIALVVLSLVAILISRAVQASLLGGLDRSLGFVFGLARGALLLIGAYLLLSLMITDSTAWPRPLQSARSLPLLHGGATWLTQQFPQAYRPRVVDLPTIRPDALLKAQPFGHPTGSAPLTPHPFTGE